MRLKFIAAPADRQACDEPAPQQQAASIREAARRHEAGGLALLNHKDREITLAAKTGDVRGAVEGGSALARSCIGQQNRCSDAIPRSIRALWPVTATLTNPILLKSRQLL